MSPLSLFLKANIEAEFSLSTDNPFQALVTEGREECHLAGIN